MIYRDFGNTGLKVSALGYGAGGIGDESISEIKVEKILNTVLDNGINLIDTARGYGASEKRIGKYLSHRRKDIILSTKVGYGIEGYKDWTYDCIIAGVDEALSLLKTDYLDIVHLHSCPTDILERGEVIDALDQTIINGKVRFAAYSGENDSLDYAINSNKFRSIMSSLNICDQGVIDRILHIAKEKSMGFIAKRPLANAAWKYSAQPHGLYAEEYWNRLQNMKISFDIEPDELALRFSVFTYGVDSCIVGTTDIKNICRNAKIVAKGILHEEIISDLRESYRRNDQNWKGQL